MRAGIAFGSNLGCRLGYLREARGLVLALPEITGPIRASRLYETAPEDSAPEAGPYLNAVIEVDFSGQPIVLLDRLQGIETALGRPSKRPRNAARTIDLDLLYTGNLMLANEEVVIPHPRLHLRRFVLEPLADIRPELILPGQERTVGELLAALPPDSGVRLFSESWET